MTWLNGHKTYIIAAATILYGVVAYVLGDMPLSEAVPLILGGGGFGALRHAISKEG